MNKKMQTRSLSQGFSKLLLLLCLLIFCGAIIGGVIVGIWVFNNVDARLVLKDQPADIVIHDQLKLTAEVLNKLEISLNEVITTQVPIKKDVSVPIDEILNLRAAIKTSVPVTMDVRVQDSIAIDQVLDLDSVVQARVLGEVIDIPIKGRVPVRADVPIDLMIPIRKKIPVDIVAPVKAKLKQRLTIPLNTVIDAEIPISSEMNVPVHSAIEALATFTKEPLPVVIQYADLKLPLRTLRLETTDEPAPKRQESK